MRICYNFASRERPEKFFRCLDNIQDMSATENYFVWAKLDDDDPAKDKYLQHISEYPELTVKWGSSNGKIHAINRSLEDLPTYDVVCTHSDDFWVTEFGFDNEIREAFKDWNGLVHFPDQVAKEKLITYPIMHHDYYNELGYVYHPDFFSVYADNFQHFQAQCKGKYKFVNKQILEHRHAIWGFGVKDALLERTEDPVNYKKDHETFLRLKKSFAV